MLNAHKNCSQKHIDRFYGQGPKQYLLQCSFNTIIQITNQIQGYTNTDIKTIFQCSQSQNIFINDLKYSQKAEKVSEIITNNIYL